MRLVYFIRSVEAIAPDEIAPPRGLATVRRSLDGKLCVLAFAPDDIPKGGNDGMPQDEMRAVLSGPDAKGVWWVEEV